jgi:protein-tyrosine phosphatase
MTSAPGRRIAGGGQRDLLADLTDLRQMHRAEVLVSLVEPYELDALGIGDLEPRARQVGLELVRLPIRDGQVPRDYDETAAVVDAVLAAARAGRTTIIHCRGGLGRTGTIAACCLVAAGTSGDEATETVRRARPGTVETIMQEAWIRSFARRRASAQGHSEPTT